MPTHFELLKKIALNEKYKFDPELRQIYVNSPTFFTKCPVVFPCYMEHLLVDMEYKENKRNYYIVYIPFAFAGRPAKSFELVPEVDQQTEHMSVEQLIERTISRISPEEQKEIEKLANKHHDDSLMAQLAVVLSNVAAVGY